MLWFWLSLPANWSPICAGASSPDEPRQNLSAFAKHVYTRSTRPPGHKYYFSAKSAAGGCMRGARLSVMAKGATIFEPPPLDGSKAPIENVLELTPVVDIGPDVYTNTRPLWHPPGARGIYGGAVIAQCLAAAMQTVPADFAVHSMHCYFVLAGDSALPILYHVERVRDGRSFSTRTVQARQRGRPIFTTTLSFNKTASAGSSQLQHTTVKPDVPLPADGGAVSSFGEGSSSPGPFVSVKAGIVNHDSPHPELKKVRRWVRARGKISEAHGFQAHLSALAYMSDSYFIGTISQVHNIARFASPAELEKVLRALKNPSDLDNEELTRALSELKAHEAAELRRRIQAAATTSNSSNNNNKSSSSSLSQLSLPPATGTAPSTRRQIGMMVSLDHSIYFHNPLACRVDDWMLTEMESPWAGEGRGLCIQKIWSKDGTLLATCTQEGVVRLKQERPAQSKM